MPIVKAPRWKRVGAWALAIALTMMVLLLGLEGTIRLTARRTGTRAAAQFGGDRITGLMALVDCRHCPLRDRDLGVWALGELRDRRALSVLQAHYTGGKCNHDAGLCQYELGKAIRKIEGNWNLRSSAAFRRSRP